MEDNKNLSRQILQYYGLRHQKAKAIEELGELIVALQKDLLSGKDGLSKDVLEEIADVHIMLTQLLDDEGDRTTVSLIVDKKLKRQIRRIEVEKRENKICKHCKWYKGPFARIGVCSYSKSELYDNYVDDDMACEKWED